VTEPQRSTAARSGPVDMPDGALGCCSYTCNHHCAAVRPFLPTSQLSPSVVIRAHLDKYAIGVSLQNSAEKAFAVGSKDISWLRV